MTTPGGHETRRLSDIFHWLEEGMPTLPQWRPFESQRIRFEDFEDDGRYVIRAELPGIEPDKDIEITVTDGVLTIRGERHEDTKEAKRSEFRYGSFSRSLRLPEGADEDDVSATYANGILEVSVPLKEAKPTETKRIQISKE